MTLMMRMIMGSKDLKLRAWCEDLESLLLDPNRLVEWTN